MNETEKKKRQKPTLQNRKQNPVQTALSHVFVDEAIEGRWRLS